MILPLMAVDVLGGDILQELLGAGSIAHGDQADVVHGEHADHAVLLIHDTAGLFARAVHELDRFVDRLVRHDRRGLIDLDLGHLDAGILEQHGLLKAEALEKILCLRAQLSKPAGHRLDAVRALEKSVADGSRDGVGIRVLMSCNIDYILVHI